VVDAPLWPAACVCVERNLDAAVWCYGSPWQGFGRLTASANCSASQPPLTGSADTFTWH
jgi:hypothetical protein